MVFLPGVRAEAGCCAGPVPESLQDKRIPRSRNALVTTDTELSAIAAPANIGDSNSPKAG